MRSHFRQLRFLQPPGLAIEHDGRIEPPHLVSPHDQFPIFQPWDSCGLQPAKEQGLTFGRPSGARFVLDVIDAKRILQNLLPDPAMMRGVAQHGIDVE